MATVTPVEQQASQVTVLRGVSFHAYLRMIQHPDNRHLRMAYYDGTLEIVAPILYLHEGPSLRFLYLVMAVSRALGLRCVGSGSMTIHRKEEGVAKGVGKEPDQGFYIRSIDRFPRERALDLNAGDPPPDLWVEVDNRVSSRGRMPVYARLGTPEVWQYRVARKSLRFWHLVDGKYVAAKQSLALPILTLERVMEAIVPGSPMADTEFLDFLDAWVPALIARAAAEDTPPAL